MGERKGKRTGNKQTNKLSFGSGCLYKRTHSITSPVQQNELNINIQADTHKHTCIHTTHTHKHSNMAEYITVFFGALNWESVVCD